jgi:hypothetical protein
MAKRSVNRHKARKAKFIEVEGHQLTAAMHADYERCVELRGPELGLGDFLSKYRPSRKVEGQLHEIFNSTTRVGIAIGALKQYPFFSGDPGVIRTGGCDLLKRLALDLYNESAKLTAIAMSVEAEKTTKLQDWLARDQEIAFIGRGAEAIHG